jgi:hypothetical protein
MEQDRQSSATSTIVCGLIAAAIGLFVIVGGLAKHGLDPVDGEPAWLGILCGLIFVLGGGAVVIQTVINDGKTPEGELPASTPGWLRAAYQLICVTIVVSMGALASWVAFGPGERQFSGNGGFLGPSVGRAAFGFGAALIWITLAAFGFAKIRRLLLRR